MTKICDECETVSHCSEHGCIPKQQALDKKADNARELGLDYEPWTYTFKQPSELPITLLEMKPNYNMTFHRDGKQIGVLDFNGPEMVFTGDADESAKVFFDFIAGWFKERLEQERADERWEQSKRRGVLMFDPYCGTPRHPSDVASDPHGILMLDPEQPMRGLRSNT